MLVSKKLLTTFLWKRTCSLHQVLLKVIAFFGRIENYSLSLYLWIELINGKQGAAVR